MMVDAQSVQLHGNMTFGRDEKSGSAKLNPIRPKRQGNTTRSPSQAADYIGCKRQRETPTQGHAAPHAPADG
jgi:hypothetical protein